MAAISAPFRRPRPTQNRHFCRPFQVVISRVVHERDAVRAQSSADPGAVITVRAEVDHSGGKDNLICDAESFIWCRCQVHIGAFSLEEFSLGCVR